MKAMNITLRYALLICLIGALTVACSPEDTGSPEPEEVFVKYFGSQTSETAVDMVAYEGGYILFGSTDNTVRTGDYFIVRVDNRGNEVWSSSHGVTATVGNFPNRTTAAPAQMLLYNDGTNDRLAVIGTVSLTGQDGESLNRMYLHVANPATGDSITSAIYPRIAGVTDLTTLQRFNSEGSDLLYESSDNTLIIVGSTENVSDKGLADNSGDTEDIFLVKALASDTRPDSVVWTRTFGNEFEDVGLFIDQVGAEYGVVSSTDRQSNQGHGGKNVLYTVVDLNGLNGRNIVYGSAGNGNDVPSDFVVTGTNSVTIIGATNSSNSFMVGIANISEVFNTSFTAGFNQLNIGGVEVKGFTRLSNGNYFLVGRQIGTDSNQDDMILFGTDQFGAIDSTRVQSFGGIQNDVANTVIENADGSLTIAGTTDFQGNATMMTILKTNSKGQLMR